MPTKKMPAQRVEELHEQIREVVERQLEGNSRTYYRATRETCEQETPEYILGYGEPSFQVELIENGPTAHIIQIGDLEQTIPIHRPELRCRVSVLSNGSLSIKKESISMVSAGY
jgi:hypothetical protein